MKVLHVGIFKERGFRDYELSGDIIFEKGLIQNNCEVERFDFRTLASTVGVKKMLNQLTDRANGKDLVFIGKGELIDKVTLQKIRKLGVNVALWYCDIRLEPEPWLIENLSEVDYFFATFGGRVLEEHFTKGKPGLAAYFLNPSDPELVLKYKHLPRCTRKVVFTGSNYEFACKERRETIKYLKNRKDVIFFGYFESRNKYENFLKRKIEKLTRSRFHSEWLPGPKYIAVIKSACVGIGASLLQNVSRFTSDRLSHYLMFGTFYMPWKFPEAELLFDLEKELICFDSIQDLDSKIEYYLSNPEEREQIVLAGQKKVLNEYNCKNMVGMILDIIKTGKSNRFDWVEVLS